MEKFYEQIEGYLLGELSGTALTDFENALQNDPKLAQAVTQHRALIQRLDALKLRNKVKAAITRQQTSAASGYTRRIFLALAVLLILLAAAIWFFKPFASKTTETNNEAAPNTPIEAPKPPTNDAPGSKSNEPPALKSTDKKAKIQQLIALAHEFQEPPTQTFMRDAAQQADPSSIKTMSQQAAEAYYQQNFRRAITLLKEDKLVADDEGARFIRANARFKLDQFAAAATDFEALNNSFQFKHEARWNFLLCQLALGNSSKAKMLLTEMSAEQDFPFRDKALTLKRKLHF